MKKKTYIYCDGGVSKWGFIVTQGTEILKKVVGDLGPGHTNDETEAEAVFQAVQYCKHICDNYTIYTDSKSVIQKTKGTWADHTGNARFKGIRNMMHEINHLYSDSRSIELKYKRRYSDEFSKYIDKLVRN